MAAADVTDLITAANVGLAFAKPRMRPGKSDSRTKVIPIVRVDRLVRLMGLRTDKFDLRQEVEIDRIVGPHPAVEASSRYSEQSQSALSSAWNQFSCDDGAFCVYFPSAFWAR